MKNFRKVVFTLFSCMLLLTVLFSTAQAAQKKGLVKEKGNYYFYENGKKVTNTWKTVKTKKSTDKYYFGKNGAAYKAPADMYSKCHIVAKKIGKKFYGFDSNAKMVTGVRTNLAGTIYCFSKSGVLNTKSTNALRSAIKSKNIEAAKKCLGQYKDLKISDSCLMQNSKDYAYFYDFVYLTIIHNNETGEEMLYELYTL